MFFMALRHDTIGHCRAIFFQDAPACNPRRIRSVPNNWSKKCGLEPGVAARQILELYVQRLRESGDYIQTLSDFSQALKTRVA